MAIKSSYPQIAEYATKDGSAIRELIHPEQHGNCNQSLAEAQIPPGVTTYLHLHHQSEEIYHIVQGSGVMTLNEEIFPVNPGDSICIPPGSPHCIKNSGECNLVILCCCSPAYSHTDTELL